MQQGYTGPEVCKITGISYRQLDHWTSTGPTEPSISIVPVPATLIPFVKSS